MDWRVTSAAWPFNQTEEGRGQSQGTLAASLERCNDSVGQALVGRSRLPGRASGARDTGRKSEKVFDAG
jgi:hypothetical protein